MRVCVIIICDCKDKMAPHPETWSRLKRQKKIIKQDDDSVVSVLEKVASLHDMEEVARLAGEAKGRKSSVRIRSCSPPNTKKAFLASGFPLISKLVGSVYIV